MFLLTACTLSVLNTHLTKEDVSQAAVHCELFTATDCERQALVCVCVCLWAFVSQEFVCACVYAEVQRHSSHARAGLRGGR